MKSENKLETVISILKKYMFDKASGAEIQPDSQLIKELKINSARIVDIVLDIEEEFDIEIGNNLLERIRTPKDLVEIIESLQK